MPQKGKGGEGDAEYFPKKPTLSIDLQKINTNNSKSGTRWRLFEKTRPVFEDIAKVSALKNEDGWVKRAS